ncbi:MAG: hypothetical protein IPF83_06360 [Rhodanobacteraceae bacterium]|mgnify:CR=1 FL=1|nr:hypothetical protein [Rhodanobacteraceae bacterium]MBK7043154.1 hypothetical protein [Rhodanobacteraceae bacterium]MBP9154559.1 hypothetical protein [Xanthomonadales bacterium]HQW80300.1 hypothetical protein [Pseudomonadota bacterium]
MDKSVPPLLLLGAGVVSATAPPRLDGFLAQHGDRIALVPVENGEWIHAPADVLPFHANALNADALPALLDRLRRRGGAGIPWLQKPKTFYEGEPKVPEHVLDLAGVEGE